ncbi:hypothetical protein ACHQM5_007773 [Ranunculus cassubicifolius]
MANTISDLPILRHLHHGTKPRPPLKMIEFFWAPPPLGYIKINTDGASKGNPGPSGWGSIFRDENNKIRGVYYGGLGISSSHMEETMAVTHSLLKAVEQGWKNFWIESDSEAVVHDFQSGKVHWLVKKQWQQVSTLFENIIFSGDKREVNFAADNCANRGVLLERDQRIWWLGSPPFDLEVEDPLIIYSRIVTKY